MMSYLKRKLGKYQKMAQKVKLVPTVPFVLMAALFAVAIFAPMIAPYDPTLGSLPDKLLPPSWTPGGSPEHFLGTDAFGRDILSRLIYGSRISLAVSLLALLFAGSIGTIVGLISGFKGGMVDAVLMRLVDMAMSIPTIFLAILLVVALGASFTNIIIVIMLVLWPRYARQIRAEALSIKEREFVALARIDGCSYLRIMLRHIFPNVVPTLLVIGSLQVGHVILMEASLSFLGVGIPPPQPAWGLMVADGRGLIASAWWVSLFPGIAIFLTVLSVNLMGDWLRDHLDPTLRQV